MCKTNIQQYFITRTIQKYNKDVTKKMYPKLMLNIVKVMCDFTFIYTHWAPTLENFLKTTSNLHVAYVHLCMTHVHLCEMNNEL
jgi:hypothetical protein